MLQREMRLEQKDGERAELRPKPEEKEESHSGKDFPCCLVLGIVQPPLAKSVRKKEQQRADVMD